GCSMSNLGKHDLPGPWPSCMPTAKSFCRIHAKHSRKTAFLSATQCLRHLCTYCCLEPLVIFVAPFVGIEGAAIGFSLLCHDASHNGLPRMCRHQIACSLWWLQQTVDTCVIDSGSNTFDQNESRHVLRFLPHSGAHSE